MLLNMNALKNKTVKTAVKAIKAHDQNAYIEFAYATWEQINYTKRFELVENNRVRTISRNGNLYTIYC